MNKRKSVKDLLKAKIGNEKSANIIEKLSHAYKKGIRAGNLKEYLNDILKNEGATPDVDQIPLWVHFVKPQQ